MKPLSIGAVFAGAALAALACRGDPTSSLRGAAKSIDMTSNVVFIDAGDARQLEVVVRDEQLNPLVADVTVASVNPSVVMIAVDTTIPVANGTTHHYTMTAVAPGLTKIVFGPAGFLYGAGTTQAPELGPRGACEAAAHSGAQSQHRRWPGKLVLRTGLH